MQCQQRCHPTLTQAMQADEQWSAVLGGLLSQLLYAMSTGFINLPRSDPQKAAAQASLSHTAASHSALAARRAAAFKNIPDARVDAEEAEVAGGGSSMAPVVTCSVTLEVGSLVSALSPHGRPMCPFAGGNWPP